MRQSCWLVECAPLGVFEGWWTMPKRGMGGWITTDPNQAKKYTESEARAVAEALSYFPTPFRWSEWKAAEHIFVDNSVRLFLNDRPHAAGCSVWAGDDCDCSAEVSK
jgi:hypothetical protein